MLAPTTLLTAALSVPGVNKGDGCVPGLSKGVGFIRFDQRIEAERAIQKLNGTIPEGATEPITVKFANNPSNNAKAIPPLAAYLAPQAARRALGAALHPASRFRSASTSEQINPPEVSSWWKSLLSPINSLKVNLQNSAKARRLKETSTIPFCVWDQTSPSTQNHIVDVL